MARGALCQTDFGNLDSLPSAFHGVPERLGSGLEFARRPDAPRSVRSGVSATPTRGIRSAPSGSRVQGLKRKR